MAAKKVNSLNMNDHAMDQSEGSQAIANPTGRLVYCFATPGCGNHMLADVLQYLGYAELPSKIVDFWPTYVLASRNPTTPSFLKSYKEQSAVDALRSYCRDCDSESGDPLDSEAAHRLFTKLLGSCESKRWFALHCFAYVHSWVHTLDSGEVVHWSLEDRDRAFSFLEEALRASGWDISYVGFIRHPVDIYLSNRERFKRDAKGQIGEFFDLLDQTMKSRRRITLVKYEDMCQRKQSTLELLCQGIGYTGPIDVNKDFTFLYDGEVWKHATLPKRVRQDLVNEFKIWIEQFNYRLSYRSTLIERLTRKPKQWKSEITALNNVFRGDYRAGGAIFRHKQSLGARMYRRICTVLPWCRRHWINIQIKHYGRRLFR